MRSMNTKRKQFSLGVVLPLRLPLPSPLRQLTSVTLPRHTDDENNNPIILR